MDSNIEIRVNGTDVTSVRMQRGIVDGYPSGQWEIFVEVPILGYFQLEDCPDFIIELRVPKPSKRKPAWRHVTLGELVSWLESLGITK